MQKSGTSSMALKTATIAIVVTVIPYCKELKTKNATIDVQAIPANGAAVLEE